MIEVTFTKGDLAKAGSYTDCDNCLMATALRRMGFKKVNVGGYGCLTIGDTKFQTVEDFDSAIVEHEDVREYRNEVVGMTFHLEEVE